MTQIKAKKATPESYIGQIFPGTKKGVLKIRFSDNWFDKDDILLINRVKGKVISTPKQTWWNKLLCFFRLSSKKIYYKVKIINNDAD